MASLLNDNEDLFYTKTLLKQDIDGNLDVPKVS